MKYEELVAIQALKIATLEAEILKSNRAFVEIHRWLFGVGQPLNDNKLGYTSPQMKNFSEIAYIIEPFISNIKF